MEINYIMTTKMENKIQLIYNKLYDLYGPQGWWPLLSVDDSTC